VEQVVPLDEQLIEQARKEMLRERVIAPLEEELAQLESEGRLRMLLPEDQE
jgi:ribosomal protein S25